LKHSSATITHYLLTMGGAYSAAGSPAAIAGLAPTQARRALANSPLGACAKLARFLPRAE